jgi:hypothetical protein
VSKIYRLFFFVEKTVTLISLELLLTPQLQQNTEVADILFQQSGAPPHYHCRDTSFLDATFTNKWVGKGGPVGWPPRSPDLTPLDFNFFDYVKDKVYVPLLPQSLRKSRDRIRDKVMIVDEVMLRMQGTRPHHICGSHIEYL